MERTKNAKEIASEYRMSHWAGIMRERAESGLSIRAYCAREGMPTNRYHYWQRRLRAAAAKELMPTKTETVARVPIGWTEVMATEEINPPSDMLPPLSITVVKRYFYDNDTTWRRLDVLCAS